MKAYVIERAGGPEVLTLAEVPSPQAKADEVTIRVRAFGVNRAEVYRRSGKMGPINGPVVPGIEAVGEVIADASGTFRTGQRVATAMGGLQFSRTGSYAEEVAVLRSNVIDLHDTTLSWEDFAALPESYLTVWGALDRSLGLAKAVRSGSGRGPARRPAGARELPPDAGPPERNATQLLPERSAGHSSSTTHRCAAESDRPGISAGSIPSLRVRTFDFGDVRQAHALMESDRVLGKLVVRM